MSAVDMARRDVATCAVGMCWVRGRVHRQGAWESQILKGIHGMCAAVL